MQNDLEFVYGECVSILESTSGANQCIHTEVNWHVHDREYFMLVIFILSIMADDLATSNKIFNSGIYKLQLKGLK